MCIRDRSRADLTRLVNTLGFKSLGANEQELNPNESNQNIQGESRPTNTSRFPNDKLDIFTTGGTRELLRYPRQS